MTDGQMNGRRTKEILVSNIGCPCIYILSPFHVIFFEASHWPSGHMISSRPLIGQRQRRWRGGVNKNLKSFLAAVLLSPSVKRFFVSRVRDFLMSFSCQSLGFNRVKVYKFWVKPRAV